MGKKYLHNSLLIFLTLIFVFSSSLKCLCFEATKEADPIIVEIESKPIVQGDSLVVKISKLANENDFPKVFFDKSKFPVFELNNSQLRSLIPLSANIKTGKHSLEVFYGGKVNKMDVIVNETKYPLQELRLPKEVAALKASRIEKDLVGKALSTVTNKKLWDGKFAYPSKASLSTPYGVKRRVNGVIDPDYFHKGLDFAGKLNSDIVAPAKGKVVLAGFQSMGFVVNGNCIFIDHGHGVVSGYLHLNKILVKEGDILEKGQLIGKVGSTGIASGPHLHWGIYILAKTVDPLNWVQKIID